MYRSEAENVFWLVLLFVVSLTFWGLYELLNLPDQDILLGAGAKVVVWWFMALLAAAWVGVARKIRRFTIRTLLITTTLAAILLCLIASSA